MSEQPEKNLIDPITSTEQLQAEQAQISAQLNTYAFRQDNKRIAALLESEEGRKLPQEARQHLDERIISNTVYATIADPEVERLFLREHEIEIILRKRRNADLYTVDGTILPASSTDQDQGHLPAIYTDTSQPSEPDHQPPDKPFMRKMKEFFESLRELLNRSKRRGISI